MLARSLIAAAALTLSLAGPTRASAATPSAVKLTADDYIEIQQLYAAYAHALDTGDGARFAQTFTEDGEFTGGRPAGHAQDVRKSTRGRAALQAMGSRGGSRHFTANLTITPTANGAHGSCYLLLFDVHSTPARMLETAIYDDTLVKTPQGWKFAKRTVWRDDDDISPYRPNPVAAAPGAVGEQKVADAKPGEIRLMATRALLDPLEAVRAEAEKVIGHTLVIEYGSARGNLRSKILAGQDFEVAILLPDVTEELRQSGRAASGDAEIAKVQIALEQSGPAPLVSVSTYAELKQALLGAKFLRWSPTGVALPTVQKIMDTLQIEPQMREKLTTGDAPALGDGEYAIGIFPLSEVIPNAARTANGPPEARIHNLGLVPSSLNVPQAMTAVVGAHAADRDAAYALIKFLQGPAIEAALRENGLSR